MTALQGIRVLDFSQGAAGPICTMHLGDLGAEVIKVEPPGGEWGRRLGPPFIDGVAAAFVGMNRNKRSVVVDLKHPAARDAILRLVARSDVLVESFRPGVMARLGLDDATLREQHPRLIYCAITAFGPSGPWRDRPGVDGIVQAAAGLMSVTGTPQGEPVKVGAPAADTVAGFLAACGILAALFVRERTGRGQRVDVSLLDALLAFQAVPLAMYLATGDPPGRTGSAAPYAAPNEAFPTADGHIMVAAYTPERWQALCAVVGRPELAADPRFATNDARVRHRAALREILVPIFRSQSTHHWLARLEAADILCGPILTYPDLETHPQVAHNGMLVPLHHPQLGATRVVGPPVRLSATPAAVWAPAPLPGEHTAAVLAEAGFTAEEIAQLAAAGVVACAAGRPGAAGEAPWTGEGPHAEQPRAAAAAETSDAARR